MTTTLFGSLFSLPRIMYAMANDGLLFGFLGHINNRTQVPVLNLAISGFLSALIALLFDLQHLVEFMSIGTFLAYTIVSASVISLTSPPTEGADSNSDCNSVTSAESEARDLYIHLHLHLHLFYYIHILYINLTLQLLDLSEGTGKLKSRYIWLANFLGSCKPGDVVTGSVMIYTAGCISLCFLFILISQTYFAPALWDYFVLANVILLLIGSKKRNFRIFSISDSLSTRVQFNSTGLFVIIAHQQSPPTGKFRVPMVPVIPALSILFNIGLMFHLTWLRFLVWMVVGESILP